MVAVAFDTSLSSSAAVVLLESSDGCKVVKFDDWLLSVGFDVKCPVTVPL